MPKESEHGGVAAKGGTIDFNKSAYEIGVLLPQLKQGNRKL